MKTTRENNEGEQAIRSMSLREFSALADELWRGVIGAKSETERAEAKALWRWAHNVRSGRRAA